VVDPGHERRGDQQADDDQRGAQPVGDARQHVPHVRQAGRLDPDLEPARLDALDQPRRAPR
jgi:hypothetical protein